MLHRSIGIGNSICKTLLLVVSKTVFTLYIVIINLLSCNVKYVSFDDTRYTVYIYIQN